MPWIQRHRFGAVIAPYWRAIRGSRLRHAHEWRSGPHGCCCLFL